MLRLVSRNSGFLSAVLLMAFALPSHAGQVRIDVGAGGNNVFSPSIVALNTGDHVVWVWRSGFHSVTSGDSIDVCSSGVGDGLFDSNVTGFNAARGTTFSWWSGTNTGTEPFVCMPHCPLMSGRLNFRPNVAVADFRITEVQTNIAGNLDLIEITNLGGAAGDLGRYRIVSGPSVGSAPDTSTVPTDTWPVPVGGRVVVHLNQSAAQSPPNLMYVSNHPGLVDAGGYLALYVPNTINTGVADETQMIDFMQWGAAGSAREGTAVSAGLWTAGTFIGTVALGHSMEFCGMVADHGANFWSGVSVPNFGTAGGCTTAGTPLSWGRLKIIYR